MLKRIKPYISLAAILLIAILVLQKIHWWPSFSNPFKKQPLLIDNTPVLVKEIRNLSQVIAISMYDEVVMEASKPKHLPSFPGLRPVPDNIVLIGKGKVLAGVDLARMNEKDVFTAGDSVSISLAGAQVFNTIVNPSDFETFDETGIWTADEVTGLKKKIRDRITARALANQILPRADQRCKLVLENFLRALGFTKINFKAPGQSP